MLLSTQGIVLHTTKYSESSMIAKIFTRELGLRGYLVRGVRQGHGSQGRANLLHPMSHLELSVYENAKRDLQYVKEMHPAHHYNSLTTDSVKMALLFFMDEVLYKSIREEEPNQQFFDYIVQQLQQLDSMQSTSESASLPLDFLILTSHHLGIAPLDNYSAHEPLFNLKEGRFLPFPTRSDMIEADSAFYLDAEASNDFHTCLQHAHRAAVPDLPSVRRNQTLSHLLEYYHLHLTDFHNFHSHQIFHSVLR